FLVEQARWDIIEFAGGAMRSIILEIIVEIFAILEVEDVIFAKRLVVIKLLVCIVRRHGGFAGRTWLQLRFVIHRRDGPGDLLRQRLIVYVNLCSPYFYFFTR